jgi:hypothetical protein
MFMEIKTSLMFIKNGFPCSTVEIPLSTSRRNPIPKTVGRHRYLPPPYINIVAWSFAEAIAL